MTDAELRMPRRPAPGKPRPLPRNARPGPERTCQYAQRMSALVMHDQRLTATARLLGWELFSRAGKHGFARVTRASLGKALGICERTVSRGLTLLWAHSDRAAASAQRWASLADATRRRTSSANRLQTRQSAPPARNLHTRANRFRRYCILQCTTVVALGGRAAGEWCFGAGHPAPGRFRHPGRFSQTFSLPDPLGRAFGSGPFPQTRSPPMGLPLAKLRQVPLLLRAALKVRHINTCDQLLAAAARSLRSACSP